MNKTLFRVILFSVLFFGLLPSSVQAAKGDGWKARQNEWVNRVTEEREREARFEASLIGQPNVMRTYFNNVAANFGITNFNAFNYTDEQLMSMQFGTLERGSCGTATCSYSGVYGNNSSGSFILYDANGNARTTVERTTGTFWNLTITSGSDGACVGWGCLLRAGLAYNGPVDEGLGGMNAISSPVPGCTSATLDGSIDLTAPVNGATFPGTQGSLTLNWQLSGGTSISTQLPEISIREQMQLARGLFSPSVIPTSITSERGWGFCCAGCSKEYAVYMGEKGSALQLIATVPSTTTSLNVNVLPNTTYSWFVIASNGSAGWKKSATWDFTVQEVTAVVQGYIWDSTAQACSLASKDSREIQRADITGSITPVVDSVSGTWDPSASGYSYIVNNVQRGANKVLCASVPTPQDKPGFKYSLSCLNSSPAGIFSGSCAYIDVNNSPVIADLGYKLTSSGWFHVLGGGDVYAGCSSCIDSISIGIPSLSDILGGFTDSLIDNGGALFANSDVSIKNPSGTDKITSLSGNEYYNKHMIDGTLWPEGFSFNHPADVEDVTDCNGLFTDGNLSPTKVYETTSQCLQRSIDNVSGSYKLSSDGVAVVYVTGGGILSFTENFRSESEDRRVIIVTDGSVEFSKDIGELAPTSSTSAHIQASIIAKESIRFLSTSASDDTTIIVEGPLVSKDGNIDMARDRGLQNGYPAQIVKYNPIYLTDTLSNDSLQGVGMVNISWVLEN